MRASFFDPQMHAWFTIVVDRATMHTLELHMTATAHFMHEVYGPFDSPLANRPADEGACVRRLLVVCLLLAAIAVPVALLGLSAPPARADGDPASDFLLTYQVFYPYYSNTPKDSLTKLKQTVADANKRGYRIRVAVITSPYDLGSVSALWEKPQAYAGFLAEELAFVYRGRLLIVSPKGYGYNEGTRRVGTTYVVRPSPKTLALVRTVPIGKGTDGLLKTADRAVRLLAARDGIKLPADEREHGLRLGLELGHGRDRARRRTRALLLARPAPDLQRAFAKDGVHLSPLPAEGTGAVGETGWIVAGQLRSAFVARRLGRDRREDGARLCALPASTVTRLPGPGTSVTGPAAGANGALVRLSRLLLGARPAELGPGADGDPGRRRRVHDLGRFLRAVRQRPDLHDRDQRPQGRDRRVRQPASTDTDVHPDRGEVRFGNRVRRRCRRHRLRTDVLGHAAAGREDDAPRRRRRGLDLRRLERRSLQRAPGCAR